MSWDERQRAMLAEMGIRVWSPEDKADEPVAADELAARDLPSDAPRDEPRHAQRNAQRDAQENAKDHAREDAPDHRPDPRLQDSQAARPAATTATTADSSGRSVDARRVTAPSSPPASRPEVAVRGPRASGVDQMDWDTLRQTVAGCTACKLCSGRRQTVFGVGNTQAHWMIVGEAPGEQEDIQGEPFVGKSGQLLDNMLRAIGQTRADAPAPQQVYIANTLKCRPPGNRNPEPDELAQCEPFLIRQIELVKPRIIVAMGRFAVQSLLRSSEPIGRLRGRVHQYQGVPLIVTYHPAYLLRNPEDKARAWDDLCLAMEVLK